MVCQIDETTVIVRKETTYNWKAMVSPTDALTEVGLYVSPLFSPTRTVNVSADTTETTESKAATENFIFGKKKRM